MWRLSSGRLPPSCRALLSPLPVCPERDPLPHPSVPSSQISRKKFLLFYFEGGLRTGMCRERAVAVACARNLPPNVSDPVLLLRLPLHVRHVRFHSDQPPRCFLSP